jgi:hypothetical protein
MMNDDLRELSDLLREGQRRSGQGSYRRRAPANAAVPYPRHARDGLRIIADQQPGNAQGLYALTMMRVALDPTEQLRWPSDAISPQA